MSAKRPDAHRPRAARRAVPAITACALAALLLLTLVDRGPDPDAGATDDAASGDGIRVRAASLRRTPDAWRLDARADIELPPAIRSGLDSGVPLEFVLAVSLHEPRRFLPDRTLLEVERRYALVYYELTRHYRVRSLDDGKARNYRSLGTALDGLGTLDGVALGAPDGTADGTAEGGPDGPVEAVDSGGSNAPADREERRLVGRLSLRLDGRALPLPLQSPFGSAWRLSSRPRVWTLPAGGDTSEGGPVAPGGLPRDAVATFSRERRS